MSFEPSQPGFDPGPSPDAGGFQGVDGSTHVEQKGFFQVMSESIGSVLTGIVLVLVCCGTLFWNEGSAVKTARALDEGAGQTVSVGNERVDAANEGRLVHISGPVRTASPLRDGTFPVEAPGLRLTRKVEMYQWREESQTSNNQTTYRYTRVWDANQIDSSSFRQPGGHQNPRMPVTGTTIIANDATLGAFRLSQAAINAAGSGGERRLEMTPQHIAAFNARFPGRAHAFEGGVYIGASPLEPRVGDVRVTYSLVPAETMSVVGRQTQGTIGPFTASNGRTILLADTTARSAEALFAEAQANNETLTWAVRVGAMVFLFAGFLLTMRPFTALAGYIPIIGSIVSAGAGVIAIVLTLVVGLPVIAVAWLAARPILAAALIAAGIAAFFGAKVLADRRKAARDAARGPAPAYGYAPAGQPAYGQPPQAPQPYGQQGYAPAPQGQPSYGHPPPAAAPYGQHPGYGQPPQAPQPYGQQGYGHPPQAAAPYGQPPQGPQGGPGFLPPNRSS